MSDTATLHQKVQTYLTSEGPVQIDSNNRFSLSADSTRVFVEVSEHANGKATLVIITAPVLFDVELTPELYKHVALHADDWLFGSLALWPKEDTNTGTLLMRHTLLGDYLDKDELMYAVYGIAGSADELDDQLQAQFGGKRFIDT